MLVGEPPYPGTTTQAVLGKIIAGKPVSAREHRFSVPANVDAAIRCAIEKLPADRFSSVQEFVKALADPGFRHGELAGAVAGTGPWKRRTLAFAGTTVVLSLIVAAGVYRALSRPEEPHRVARFVMALPGGLPSGNNVYLAMSPDGARLVYTRSSQLFQRRLDNLAIEPIPGTDRATNPVLSPDGASVAFVVGGGSLRIVSLLGGAPRTVVPSGVRDIGGGIDWASEGILYFTNEAGALMRIPASGGEPEPVTANDAGTHHVWVNALPGGRGLLFTITRGSPEQSEIAVMGFEEGDVRTLLPGVMARYAASGHLLYTAADGTLLGAPFDLGRLEVTGPSVPLIEDVVVRGLSASQFAVSSTGTLLYVQQSDANDFTPLWIERDGTVREIDPGWRVRGNAAYSSFALSPDDGQLVISIQDSGSRFDLWLKRVDERGPLQRLTFEGTQNRRAAWSPDGESVTFISDRAGGSDLWRMRVDGGGAAELVLHTEVGIREGLYSPDGAWLVYREGSTGGGADIYAIRLGTDSVPVPVVATEFIEHSPVLSPDGRSLAYVSDRSGQEQVYVSPFPGGISSGLAQVSSDGGTEPLWAHSGEELFYRNGLNELVAVDVSGDPSFAASRRVALFSMVGYQPGSGYPQYDVSFDDQRFVMLRIEDDGSGTDGLILVQNFFEELKERVPN